MSSMCDKIVSVFCRVKYLKNIVGKGIIILGKEDYLKINRKAKIILNNNLTLNAERNGNNGRSSNLRMDEGSELVSNGFSFMYGSDIILFKDSKLILGERSFINCDSKIRCHKQITIGNDCAISHDFTVMDSDAHELDGNRKAEPVHIGNHVWIGTRVTVLKGVTVGDGAVITAGSLVIRNVPPGALVGGIPASVIKEKVEWKN